MNRLRVIHALRAAVRSLRSRTVYHGFGSYVSMVLVLVLVIGSVPLPAIAAEPEAPPPSPMENSAPPTTQVAPTTALADPAPYTSPDPTPSATLDGAEGSAVAAGATVNPTTGAAQTSIRFELPRGRGQAQPSLGISYSSAAGASTEIGYGWSLNIPSIERENRGGGPDYIDADPGDPKADRLRVNGMELIPICTVSGRQCSNGHQLQGEQLPDDLNGWYYFRTTIDNGARYFWSANRQTFRADYKSGIQEDYGVPPDNTFDSSGIDFDHSVWPEQAKPFRWKLVRRWSEVHANVVVYRWERPDNYQSYLTDIYYSPPASADASEPMFIPRQRFAHHVHLAYSLAPYAGTASIVPWHLRPRRQLDYVDVTSKDFLEPGNRHLVKRYDLAYSTGEHARQKRSFLERVHLMGACPDVRENENDEITGTCVTQERNLAEMTYTGYGPINTSPGAHILQFQHGGEWDRTGLRFVDVDGDGKLEALAISGYPTSAPLGIQKNSNSYTIGTLDILNPSSLGQNVSYVTNSPVTSWDHDGQSNFVVWKWDNSNSRYTGEWVTYSPKQRDPSQQDAWTLVDTAHEPVSDSMWIRMQMEGAELGYHTGTFADVDGDGNLDRFNIFVKKGIGPDTKRYTRACSFFTRRDPTGKIIPNSVGPASSAMCKPRETDPEHEDDTHLKTFYTDFTGDGVPDRVTMKWVRPTPGVDLFDQEWRVGHGEGRTFDLDGTIIPGGLTGMTSVNFVADTYLHDINGDNIADRIDVRNTAYDFGGGPITDPNPGIDIYFGDGTKWVQPPIHFSPTPTNPPFIYNWAQVYRAESGVWLQPMKLHFSDAYGTGNAGSMLITTNRPELDKLVARYDIIPGRPGLLSTITNGIGATTKIEYGKTDGVPGTHFHVTKVTVSNYADEAGGPYVSSYGFSDPAYDYLGHQFRGFRKVRMTSGDSGDPSRVTTDTRYLLPGCEGDQPCAPAVDNPRWAVRGLAASVDTYDANNVHLSTTHRQYKMDKLYDGADGRKVRLVYPQQTDTWIFDTAGYVADGGEVDVVDLVSSELTLQGRHLIASRSKAVHTRTTQGLDRFGNVEWGADSGVVESFDPAIPKDSPIVDQTEWTLPVGDTTHWIWRPKDTFVRESFLGPNLRHSSYIYNASGQVLQSFADLSGTLPLQRFHEDSADVAPTPADASQNRTNVLVSDITYDQHGNPKRVKNATGTRCSDTTYDADYAQLAITQTVYTGGCGVGGLSTTADFDRGLELPTVVTEPTGAVTTTTYDGWGRPTAIYKSDAEFGVLPSTTPSAKMTYVDVPFGPYQRVKVEKRVDDGPNRLGEETPRYVTTWSYIDPHGRVTGTWREADPANGDQGPYIASGRVRRDSRGFVTRRFEPYFSEVPGAFLPPEVPASVPSSVTSHDAFGRPTETRGLEGELIGRGFYHALSEHTFDAADLAQGATPHPVQSVRDGHGRPTVTVKTTHQTGSADALSTHLSYAPTGELKRIVRAHTSGSDTYSRDMTYDSWGRLVQTAEPNTSTGFGTPSVKTWRYAYNDSGDLVGTSDARGCGKNLEWDGLGRLTSETYSPCLRSQRPYDGHATNLFIYDAPEQGHTGVNPAVFAGKLAASYDRAQHTRYNYDARGRTMEVLRQLAVPDADDLAIGGGGGVSGASSAAAADGGAPPTPGGEYTPHWYRTAFAYDEADRERARAIGTRSAEVPELYGHPVTRGWLTGGDLVVTTYTARGLTKTIGTSYGNLIMGKTVEADGFVRSITYGDSPQQVLASFHADGRRRLDQTDVAGPSPGPALLQNWAFKYDDMDNPISVTDGRTPGAWPDGAKPVSRTMAYDDLNQLRRVDYNYGTTTSDDKQVSVFDAETKSGDLRPIPEGNHAKRVKWQSYDFDWQGNLTKSDDDAHAFHDRSSGTMTYGPAANGPNRVASAEGPRGNAHATYDTAGNLTKLTVTKPGPTGALLNVSFSYEWDEVGQMVRAKRERITGIAGDRGADFHYTYDSGGRRVTKSVEDPDTFQRTYSSEVFSTLRIEHARFQNGDYERTKKTVTGYLVANGAAFARLIYDEDLPQGRVEGPLHVFFTLTDPMGSTSTVIDKNTGELVERTTYLAYGQAESDYRPERWKAYREHFRFTGKEDDVGVGLTYFGARYYVPALGQWASADPLTIHQAGSDLNPYAYVLGSPQRLTDPTGLAPCLSNCEPENAERGIWDLGLGDFMRGMEASITGGGIIGKGLARYVSTPHMQAPPPQGVPENDYQQLSVTWDCDTTTSLRSCSLIILRHLTGGALSGLGQFLSDGYRQHDPIRPLLERYEEMYYYNIAEGRPGWYPRDGCADSRPDQGCGGAVPLAPGGLPGASVPKGTQPLIPWSNKGVKSAAEAIERGVSEVTVNGRDEAGELFLGLFQGKGFTNTTGMTGKEVRQALPTGKAGTYHWDLADTMHGGRSHLQVHDESGSIFRIFF